MLLGRHMSPRVTANSFQDYVGSGACDVLEISDCWVKEGRDGRSALFFRLEAVSKNWPSKMVSFTLRLASHLTAYTHGAADAGHSPDEYELVYDDDDAEPGYRFGWRGLHRCCGKRKRGTP